MPFLAFCQGVQSVAHVRPKVMEWLISDDKGSPICNFEPEVLAVVNVLTIPSNESAVHIKMILRFSKTQKSKEFSTPLSDLDNVKWQDIDRLCRFHPKVSTAKAKRYIADVVRKAMPNADDVKQYRITQLGAHDIDGNVVFNTGGELIGSLASQDVRTEVIIEPLPFSLDIDIALTENEAAAGMLELISLSPEAGRVIFAYVLLYIKRKVYEDIWKSPCFIVFLWGLTGTKKTTLSAFLTQMHNRLKGILSPPRLNSSVPAAIKIIYEKNDCVVVLDDLFPAESTSVKKKQEETLSEVIRVIGDNIEPARVRGGKTAKQHMTCGVTVTAEYIYGTGSDAARLLPVEATPPDGKQLKYFQDHPLIVSTFYHHYIKWFIENYGNIKGTLKKWLDCYHKSNLGVHERLKETHFFLGTSHAILLQYLHDKKMIPKQDAERLNQSFLELLDELVHDQQKRVEQGMHNRPNKFDLLAHVYNMYKNGCFHLAGSAKHFVDGQHDGLIHNGFLCLRSKSFKGKVCNAASTYSYTDAISVLRARGLLKRDKDGRNIQIHGTGGIRFVAIDLNKLREIVTAART